MGLMDAFSAEDRVEITVKELITILDARAKAESAFDITMNMLREGVSPKTVRAVFGYKPKEKEPTAAATAESSKDNIIQVQNTTSKPESQALRGVNILGLIQTMLEEAYGTDAEIMSLKADSDTASIVFRYGGTAYSVQFGIAF